MEINEPFPGPGGALPVIFIYVRGPISEVINWVGICEVLVNSLNPSSHAAVILPPFVDIVFIEKPRESVDNSTGAGPVLSIYTSNI